MSRLYFQLCRFMLFFVAASASFSGFYDKSHFSEPGVTGNSDPARFETMVDGTAYRPYVYRQMLPEIANLLDRIVPDSIKTKLYIHQGSGLSAYMPLMAASPTAANRTYFFRYLVVYTFTFLFALLAVYAMSWVCQALKLCEPASIFAPVILVLVLPYLQSRSGYFYDYSELAFLALAVWIALQFDWWWIIPLAALGAWNKESYILIVLTLYPLIRRRNSRFASLLAVTLLCAICLCVIYPIRIRFAHNPGSTVEVWLTEQGQYLLHPRTLILSTEENYGVRALKAYSVFPIAMLIWSVRRVWGQLRPEIQQHAKIAAAINIPLFVLFCAPGELRDLSMLYIVLLLVIATNLQEWIGSLRQPIVEFKTTEAV